MIVARSSRSWFLFSMLSQCVPMASTQPRNVTKSPSRRWISCGNKVEKHVVHNQGWTCLSEWQGCACSSDIDQYWYVPRLVLPRTHHLRDLLSRQRHVALSHEIDFETPLLSQLALTLRTVKIESLFFCTPHPVLITSQGARPRAGHVQTRRAQYQPCPLTFFSYAVVAVEKRHAAPIVSYSVSSRSWRGGHLQLSSLHLPPTSVHDLLLQRPRPVSHS